MARLPEGALRRPPRRPAHPGHRQRRLDLYRFGGDSLQGRYHLLRLHPFSVAELGLARRPSSRPLTLGGFPEPFLGGSEVEARRWSREYRTAWSARTSPALERIQDLGTSSCCALRLPELVGRRCPINALREDLQVSHKTVAGWLAGPRAALRDLPPAALRRAAHPGGQEGAEALPLRLVAGAGGPAALREPRGLHLLKWVHFEQDAQGRDLELRYFRDTDGREVDFVVVERRRPLLLVECKWGDAGGPRPSLPQGPLPGSRGLAGQLRGPEGLPDPEGIRVAPAGNSSTDWCESRRAPAAWSSPLGSWIQAAADQRAGRGAPGATHWSGPPVGGGC